MIMKKTFILFLLISIISITSIFAQTGILSGTIKDEQTSELLPAATIVVPKYNIGTITDANGNYNLAGIPVGLQTVVFNFIGFESQTIEIEIVKNQTEVANITMIPIVFMSDEVIITAQARGQVSAINEQINADGIKNVISAEKLQELPDISAADAIGRLPGITVQRDGGEGQKIIVRGFEPKYNTISINGLNAPSTDLNNRSTDMNMISTDIIAGVEVMKANTADKDAEGLGGNVNMILKQAESGLKLKASAEMGYSGQINALGSYKGNIVFSNRFFDEKFGVLVSANTELYDRSSDQWDNEFTVRGNPDTENGETFVKPWLNETSLKAVEEKRQRNNASLLFDFKTKNSLIKTSTFYSGLKRNYFVKSKKYSLEENYIKFKQQEIERTNFIFSNAIQGTHNIKGTVLDWGVGNSLTNQKQPFGHEMLFRHTSPFIGNPRTIAELPPEDVITDENVDEEMGQYHLYSGEFYDYESPESETNIWANWEVPFNITPNINISFKTGFKYRQKDKKKNTRNYKEVFSNMSWVHTIDSLMPGLVKSDYQGLIGIESFIDENYDGKDFLNERYENVRLDNSLDRDMVQEFYDKVGEDNYRYIPTGHIKYDYKGHEKIYAGYGMFNIKLGKKITFIPGLRYEYSHVRYTAFNGDAVPDDPTEAIENLPFTDTTTSTSNVFWLPQIHLKYKPLDWLDIRLAYTNTLSRPDYNDYAPRTQISSSSATIRYSGTYLNPVVSENFDAILTFYKPKYGLLTFGAFHKNVDGFIYYREALLVKGSDTDPANFNLPDSYLGYKIKYPKNNPERTYINGFEVEMQTNFHYLPSPFNGIVLSGNFTLMDSKTKYQQTLIERELNPDYGQPGEPRIIYVNRDTAYVDAMLYQAKYLANFSLGYDYKNFSARLSYTYTDEILTKEQRRADGADRELKVAFSRWDLQIKQKITPKLSVYGNINNVFNQPDEGVRAITGYYNYIEYYGMSINVGVKYRLF